MKKILAVSILFCSLNLIFSCAPKKDDEPEIPNSIAEAKVYFLNFLSKQTFKVEGDYVIQSPLDLTWQTTDLSNDTLDNAISACNSLSDDNKKWRLPTAFEFFSISDYKESLPITELSINLSQNRSYWTSSMIGDYYVQFTYRGNYNLDKFRSTSINVRCVSGIKIDQDLLYPPNRWQKKYPISDSDEAIVYDSLTNLIWTSEAFKYPDTPNCNGPYAGINSWRIPSILELLSLYDLRSKDFIIDRRYFSFPLTGSATGYSTDEGKYSSVSIASESKQGSIVGVTYTPSLSLILDGGLNGSYRCVSNSLQ